jgi:hypothetical protein
MNGSRARAQAEIRVSRTNSVPLPLALWLSLSIPHRRQVYPRRTRLDPKSNRNDGVPGFSTGVLPQ